LPVADRHGSPGTTLRSRLRGGTRLRLAFRFADLAMALAAGDAKAGAQTATLRLILLGTPRLSLGDGTQIPLERLMAALLAMLAIDGPMPRAHAASLLWPDADDKGARNNLRQRLFRLRQAARCDVVQPDDTLTLIAGVTHDLTDVAARLRDDADAAGGELLGNLRFDDVEALAEWVAVAREQWAVARRNALADIASKLEAEGRLAPALRYAERLIADAPLLEHAHRRLMRLHYLRGDRAAALTAFERCRDVLRQELAAMPGTETLELAQAIESSAAPTRAPPARTMTVLRPPRLIGRDAEWHALTRAWQQRRACVLIGEPGIGKTRLAGDWAATADGTTMAGSRPGDGRVPYALLARLLRTLVERWGAPQAPWITAELARLLPDLGVASTAKSQPLKLYQAMAAALTAMTAAGLTGLVLDDLQFADEASTEALLWLMAQDAGRELQWLLVLRANEMPAAVLRLQQVVDADRIAELRLGPLDIDGVRRLLESLAIPGLDAAAWAQPMARHTGGNPMFILETLLAMLAGGAPDGAAIALKLPAPAHIGQLIEQRLQQLSAPALRLARVAALAGQDFSVDVAASVLGQHALDIADAWHELEAAQVIRDSSFAHDLIQEATLRSVPRAIASALHKDIAAYLATHDGQPARVAGHHFEAGEWAHAGAQFRIAADRARAAAEYAGAIALYQRTEDSFEKVGMRTERLDAMRMRAACLQFQKRFDDYTAVGQQMMALAVTPLERLWALDAVAKSRFEATADEESIRLLREGRLLAEQLGDAFTEVSLAEWEALGLSFLGHHREAMDVGRKLAEYIASHPDDENAALRKRQYAYLLEMDNQFEAAIELLQDADTHARAHGEVGLVSEIQVIRGACLYNLGRVEPAINEYEAARRLLLESMSGKQLWTIYDLALGRYLAEAGRYREAVALLAAALEYHGPGDDWFTAQCTVNLAQCHITLGQFSRAHRLLGDKRPSDAMARAAWLLAQARLARSESRAARPLLHEVAGQVAASPRAERLLWQVNVELVRELDGDAAVDLARQIARSSRDKNTASAFLPATVMLVDALRRAGCGAESAQVARALRDELETHAVIGIYEAELWWLLYLAFDAADAPADAQDALRRGAAWVRTTAHENVPDEFRSSFLDRNPVNRALLTTASRRK